MIVLTDFLSLDNLLHLLNVNGMLEGRGEQKIEGQYEPRNLKFRTRPGHRRAKEILIRNELI